MKKASRYSHSTLNELNITPLLDLVFVLLVIFIITTPQLVNNLEMFLPSAKPQPLPQNAVKPKVNRIVVQEDGKMSFNESIVSLPELRSALVELKKSEPDPSVIVKGHDEVDFQYMVSVLDVLQQLDISKVGLATDAPPAVN
ncbi:MAG: ExbD/TolR family protein [Limisphaerales bacterium]